MSERSVRAEHIHAVSSRLVTPSSFGVMALSYEVRSPSLASAAQISTYPISAA